jgi:energy-coupling factor transporter ATP-binding protein EcfA2
MANASKNIALEARGIRASLGNNPVLHGIDLALPAGRWTSVVGPNGAGKSTLLKVLAGLLPHSGEVQLLGQPLARLTGRQRAVQLSWLGQNESSGDDLTVLDVVMLGRLPHQPWLGAPSAADHAAVQQALQATQAWDWRQRALGHPATPRIHRPFARAGNARVRGRTGTDLVPQLHVRNVRRRLRALRDGQHAQLVQRGVAVLHVEECELLRRELPRLLD